MNGLISTEIAPKGHKIVHVLCHINIASREPVGPDNQQRRLLTSESKLTLHERASESARPFTILDIFEDAKTESTHSK